MPIAAPLGGVMSKSRRRNERAMLHHGREGSQDARLIWVRAGFHNERWATGTPPAPPSERGIDGVRAGARSSSGLDPVR
jgi:hypothetical protein